VTVRNIPIQNPAIRERAARAKNANPIIPTHAQNERKLGKSGPTIAGHFLITLLYCSKFPSQVSPGIFLYP
jgi:hypothetical protein